MYVVAGRKVRKMNKSHADSETLRLQTVARFEVLDTPPEPAFERITRLVTALLNVPIAAVTVVDEERQWFKSQIGLGVPETPRDQSFCAHAMLEAAPLVVRDAQLDARFAHNPLVTGDPNIRFYVGVPLRSEDGTPIGALCGIDSQPRDVDQRELDVLADLATLTMEQLELRLMATLDGLTGAMRRGPFLSSAARDIALARRQVLPLSCLMIDADHFKQINDAYGHGVGDQVLLELVRTCRSTLRRVDSLGRMGGEEFCAFLPATDHAGALEVAERLRQKIEGIAIATENASVSLTVSIGVGTLTVGDAVPEDLIRRADSALYRAKAAGRNRVVGSTPPGTIALAS
jgi:diguanylate cyclase (GGDEF)-like protein